MNDKGKILFGLVVFLAAATFPIWYGVVFAGSGEPPELEIPAGETQCVEATENMAARHMDILDSWRDRVVRDGEKIYISEEYNTEHEMSLTRTCMKCHANKETFCDRCHTYADVDPYCWDCHVEPKGD